MLSSVGILGDLLPIKKDILSNSKSARLGEHNAVIFNTVYHVWIISYLKFQM